MTSQLKELFDSLNLTPEQIEDLVQTMKENPMAALAKFQSLNLPPDFLPKAMQIIMANPQAIHEFAGQMGMDEKDLEKAQKTLDGLRTKP